MNNSGEVAGIAIEYSPAGAFVAQDAWLFNGSTTRKIGPSSVTGDVTYANNMPIRINDAGQILGFSTPVNSQGQGLGQIVWLSDGVTYQNIGLSGPEYQIPFTGPGGGTQEYSDAFTMNDVGQVAGQTMRYDATGNSLGRDVWFYQNGITQQVGLVGPNYSYTPPGDSEVYESSQGGGLRAVGTVIGYTQRYNALGNSLGEDAWIFTGGITQQIGLLGSNYSYSYNGPGGGVYQSSSTASGNDANQVIGVTNRYASSGASLGQDTWIFNGHNTVAIGLTGNGYSYSASPGNVYESSYPAGMNNFGDVAGTSTRMNAAGRAVGSDAWFFDGKSTRAVGLTGFSASVVQINDAGQAIGYTTGITTGNAGFTEGWFFDEKTETTTLLTLSTPTERFVNTEPEILTDSGVVLGEGEFYVGSTDEGTRAFLWSDSLGFRDLGSLISGGLTAQGWDALADVYAPYIPGTSGELADGSPEYIVGIGSIVGQLPAETYDPDYNGSSFLLTALPEPGSLGILGLSGIALLRHRVRTKRIGGMSQSLAENHPRNG